MMNKDSNIHSKESVIDFSVIYAKYKRYWWLFAVSLVFCFGVAILYLIVKKPVYSLNTKVLVAQDENGNSMGASLIKSFSLGGGGADVDDELVVLGAQSIREKMISELKLNRSYFIKDGLLKKEECYNNSPVEINAPDELFDTLSVAIKFNLKVSDGGKDISVVAKKGLFNTLAEGHYTSFPFSIKTPYGVFSFAATKFYKPNEDLEMKMIALGNALKAESLDNNINVEKISKKSNGLAIYLEETDIKRGKDMLNRIVDLYNERGQKEKDEMATNTGEFIKERLVDIYTSLSESEDNIESYKKNNKIISIESEAGYLFGKKKGLDNAITQAELELNILHLIKDFIANPANKNTLIPFSADFGLVQKPIESYNQLVLERQKLLYNAKGDNAMLRVMDDQIEAIKKNVVLSVAKAIETSSVRLAEMRSQDSLSGGKMDEIPTKEKQYLELMRQQKIKNELYTFLLQKQEENELVLAATTPKGKIVDKAYNYSEPIAPKKALVLIMALFFSVILPILVLYIKSVLSVRFVTLDELEDIVKTPVLGEVCKSRHKDSLVVKPGRTTPTVELFRLIRNNIQFMLPDKDKKVILVTSSMSGEGKSFVSLNVASSFALLGKKVALLGMDIRNPKLAQYLNLNSTPGITSFLADSEMKLELLVQHVDEVSGLDVFVSGPIPPNPSELLLSTRVEALFDELKSQYDYIIVDSAPIALVSDTFSLSRFSDMILFVTRANYTKRSFIKYLNTIVRRGQLKNVATILNYSNPKISHGYGYGYGAKEENEN